MAALALFLGCIPTGIAAASADAEPVCTSGCDKVGPGASWGAIASKSGWYGYSFNHKSRSAAELAARAQCDKAAGRTGTCDVRAYFDRSCGALAAGNFGEWGTAIASTASAAGKGAIGQCESRLPTEPCKLLVSVCSTH